MKDDYSEAFFARDTQSASKSWSRIHRPEFIVERAAKAKNFIDSNLRNPDFELADLAKHLELEYRYCSRWFRATIGVKFVIYLRKRRIEMAKPFLMTNRYDGVKMIAYLTGFRSSTDFGRVFHCHVGMSPK